MRWIVLLVICLAAVISIVAIRNDRPLISVICAGIMFPCFLLLRNLTLKKLNQDQGEGTA